MSMAPEQVMLELGELEPPKVKTQRAVEKPSLKLPNGLGLFLLLSSVLLIFGLIYHLGQEDTLPIKQVSVGGDFRNLSPVTLQELIHDRVKAGFFNLNVQDVREAVIDEAWVDDVIVQRVWPDKVHVIITEKKPFVRWNENALLTEAAVLFQPEANTIPAELPELSGPQNSEQLVLRNYQSLAQQISALGTGLSIQSMTLDERRSWSVQLSNGSQVVFGRENYDERVKRLLFWLPAYLQNKLNEIEVIDLRYTNGFAIRWRAAGGNNGE